jgi:hypothetical protein
MSGGHLTMPEFGITINCRDGWVLYFNGNKYVHGVTPMAPKTKDAYRYSIVFYALRGMKDCHTYALEVGEARKKRTAREQKMAELPAGGLTGSTNGRSSGSVRISKK